MTGKSHPAVLVTASMETARKIAVALEARRLRPLLHPTIRQKTLPPGDRAQEALAAPRDYRCIAFTSPAAVRSFFELCEVLEVPRSAWEGTARAAVGAATASALEEVSLPATVIGEEGALSLARLLLERAIVTAGDRVLQPRAARARPELEETLRDAKVLLIPLEVYETGLIEGQEAEALRAALRGPRRPAAVAFTSPSTLEGFLAATGEAGRQALLDGSVLALCLGKATRGALVAAGIPVAGEADAPTPEALAELAATRLAAP